MKVTADRKALADALAWVGQALAKNPRVPVLTGIRLTAEGATLQLSAFDFERSHSIGVSVEVGEPGECLVTGGFLRSIVAAMSGSSVDLALDGPSLSIASGRATYKARTLELGEYPNLPDFPEPVGHAEAAALAAGIAAVKHAIDHNSSVPNIQGVRLEGSEELMIVGTDRFRIATAAVPWQHDAGVAVTVPVDGFEAAVKGMSGTVTIGHAEGSFGLRDDTRAVTLRTFAAEYPAWARILEVTNEQTIVVDDAADIKDALRRIREVDGDGLITVDYSPGELSLSGRAEVGEGDEAVTVETEASGRVGFNPRYLAESLAAIPGGPVTIHAGSRGVWLLEPVEHPHLSFAVMSKRL